MMGRYSYEITYACGHTGEVEFYGKERDCEWRSRQEAKKICPDCVEKKKEEETAQAKAWAKEKGLPDLEGTERQIAWAEVIRRRLLEDLEKCQKNDEDSLVKLQTSPSEKLSKERIESKIEALDVRLQAADEIRAKWEKESQSKFWIDGRNTTADWEVMNLCRPIRKRREEDLESKVYENGATEDEEIRIYISPERNEVKILSEYNEKKVAILKRMGFKFFDFKKCWYRYPSPAMPTVSDIAATAANELVKVGFVVRVFDQDVMSLLDTESFRPFNPRELIGDDHQFIMRLDDEIKEMALSLPGAKEIKGRIRIPAKYRAEVDDFAHVYGFAISEAAQYVIVDGFHRYSIFKDYLKAEEIPVVVLEQDLKQRMASTIQFNRARGVHQTEMMADLVKAAIAQGSSETDLTKHMGMDLEEVFRLKQQAGIAEQFKDYPWSKSWIIENLKEK